MIRIFTKSPPLNVARSAFDLGSNQRKLRVLVDASSLAKTVEFQYLHGFQFHPEIEFVTFGEGGIRSLEFVEAISGSDSQLCRVTHADGCREFGSYSYSRFLQDARDDVAAHLSVDINSSRVAKELIFAAIEYPVDVFVSTRPEYGITLNPSLASQANLMSVTDALHVIGVFLRARRDDTVMVGENTTISADIDEQTLAGLWHSYPSFADWVIGGRILEEKRDYRLEEFVTGSIRRIQQLVITHDQLMSLSLETYSGGVSTRIRLSTDAGLVFAAGAMDAIARGINLLVPNGMGRRAIGLHHDDWRDHIRGSAPKTVTIIEANLPLIRLIHLLRNHIHAETYADIVVRSPSGPSMPYHRIPKESSEKFLQYCAEMGQPYEWGIQNEIMGDTWVDFPVLMTAIVARSLPVLNEVLKAAAEDGLYPLGDTKQLYQDVLLESWWPATLLGFGKQL